MTSLSPSQKNIAQPGLAANLEASRGYARASLRGVFEEAGKQFHLAGIARVSNAAPGVFRVASSPGSHPLAMSSTHHVTDGRGTQVENVGFMVRTSYNTKNEPVVTIYPFGIDPKEPGGFFDNKISRIVEGMVRDVEARGVRLLVDGVAANVVPREIVGITVVLDAFGRKPVQWARPNDSAALLRDLSFSFQR